VVWEISQNDGFEPQFTKIRFPLAISGLQANGKFNPEKAIRSTGDLSKEKSEIVLTTHNERRCLFVDVGKSHLIAHLFDEYSQSCDNAIVFR
jgi:hypothetical protein